MIYLDDSLTEAELLEARNEEKAMRSIEILAAIKTSEWHRYTGGELDYATAGTHGWPGAIDLRCALPDPYCALPDPYDSPAPQPIEYRRVGTETWLPTGYSAVMRYDRSRDHESDGDGYEFIPYRVTQVQITRLPAH